MLQGVIEEEEVFPEEFRHTRGVEGRIHRKRTASNLRDSSKRSSRSSVRRSVFFRPKSMTSISDNPKDGGSLSIHEEEGSAVQENVVAEQEQRPAKLEQGPTEQDGANEPGIEMEMVTVHLSAEAD